jgi:predicted transposase YbfD/YdcC
MPQARSKAVQAFDQVVDWLEKRHDWSGLKSVVMVESIGEIISKKTEPATGTRFYISSLVADAESQGEAFRGHWGIENSHHWAMDRLLRDDECRIRLDKAPANFTTIKHMAGNILEKAPGKQSLRAKRRLAAWDDIRKSTGSSRPTRADQSSRHHLRFAQAKADGVQ